MHVKPFSSAQNTQLIKFRIAVIKKKESLLYLFSFFFFFLKYWKEQVCYSFKNNSGFHALWQATRKYLLASRCLLLRVISMTPLRCRRIFNSASLRTCRKIRRKKKKKSQGENFLTPSPFLAGGGGDNSPCLTVHEEMKIYDSSRCW